MKKLLAFIISLVIVLTSMSNGIAAFASEATARNLYIFADKLSEMVKEHDVQENISDNVSVNQFNNSVSQFEEKYAHLGSTAFVSKRLVVKSEKKIDYQGAIDCVSGYRDLYILQYETFEQTQKAYDYYLTLDYIDYVEPDYVVEMQGEEAIGLEENLDDVGDSVSDVVDDVKDWLEEIHPNEDDNLSNDFREEEISYVSSKIGFNDIKEDLAKRVEDDYIQIAVLDTGVDTDHEFLQGRLLEGNVNFSNTGEPNSVEDDFGHGTHVAGIIVDNTLSNVKIKPYKVLNRYGNGSESLIAIAVDLAVAEGADIINMSLKSDGVFQTMIDSVNNAVANDVNVVVAAGNDHKDLSKNFVTPACVEAAITVSAVTEDNKLSEYSNYNGTIDICAPGDNIESSYNNGGYVKLSGTSMAAPQVAAGLAVIYTAFPDKTASEAEEMLKDYAIYLYEPRDENKFGAGLLYLKYILEEKPRTAEPVFSMDSCEFNNSFVLTITCPEQDAKIVYLISDEEDFININFSESEVYSTPITIFLDTKIYAFAIADGKKISEIVKKEYTRANSTEEDMYDINTSGMITGYFGEEIDLVIPKKIRNKTVKGIANGAFKGNDKIRSVSLPSTATRILNEAFMDCKNLEAVTGSGITQVDKDAFKNSSISKFPFDNLTKIGISAFQDCKNLTDVKLGKAVEIQASAFEGARGLTSLESEDLTLLGMSAFKESDIQTVDVPNVTSLASYVFQNCENLTSVIIPMVKTIAGSTFENCKNLKEVDIPLVESIGASAFRNTGIEYVFCYRVKTLGNFAFAENEFLAFVSLPKVTTIGTYAFQGCPELQVVNMPVLRILTNDSFSDCPKLLQLWLPSVETINKGALDNSSIEYMQFDVVTTIKSLPKTLKGIVAPSTLTTINCTIPKGDFVVYGYENTYAEEFANENGKQFSTIPAIIYDLKDKIDPEDTFIMVYALGFNCQYQWYRNSEVSNIGGTIIDGATNYYYEPSDEDPAQAYYCVITSSDGINTNSIVTKPIRRASAFVPADYSRYHEAVDEANAIDRSMYREEELSILDHLVSIDVSGLADSRQEELDSLTEKIRDELDKLKTPLALGDLNGDGAVTSIDVRIALKYVAEITELSKREIIAGDLNEDGELTSLDVRYILQKAAE